MQSTAFFITLGNIWLANFEKQGTVLVAIGTSGVSVITRLNLLSDHLKLHQTLRVEVAERLMPRYEVDCHYVNFLQNSPVNGILYRKKTVWNGYETPLNFLATSFKNAPPSDTFLEGFPTHRLGPVFIGVSVSTSIYISITPSTSTFLYKWLPILPWAPTKTGNPSIFFSLNQFEIWNMTEAESEMELGAAEEENTTEAAL